MNVSGRSLQEQHLLARLAEGDVAAFEYIFTNYYKTLCRLALRYVRSTELAEELVDDVLITLWQKRQLLRIDHSLSAYLSTAVRNSCLNYLKSQYARQQFHSDTAQIIHPSTADEILNHQELVNLIQSGIDALPPACRTIFQLSRQAEMSYVEIGQELGISPKTVKAQMGIALKKLRLYLGRYWDYLLLLTFHFFS